MSDATDRNWRLMKEAASMYSLLQSAHDFIGPNEAMSLVGSIRDLLDNVDAKTGSTT
jgi:hypothetical protein